MKNIFKNSTVLITGGTGSWGQELTRQLLAKHEVGEIRILSRGEQKQVEMKRRFQDDRIKYFIGDVRDKDRLRMALSDVDFVFHLAALKHVPVCEENPWESVQTNILGVQNLIEAAIENKVRKVIDVSTDKAVDPLNLYGVCKACGEKMMIAANLIDDTRFVCFRAGNVTGTNGSAIPLFREQLLKLNKITLTDPRMTRFLIKIEDAVSMLIRTALVSFGGEIFVMKTDACRIADLADVMAAELGRGKKQIEIVGIRPGEKLSEALVSRYEMARTYEADDYYIILPQIKLAKEEKIYQTHYSSKLKSMDGQEEVNSGNVPLMSRKKIKALLESGGWLDPEYNSDVINYLHKLKNKDLEKFVDSEMWFKRNAPKKTPKKLPRVLQRKGS